MSYDRFMYGTPPTAEDLVAEIRRITQGVVGIAVMPAPFASDVWIVALPFHVQKIPGEGPRTADIEVWLDDDSIDVLTRGQPWVVGTVADALAARLAERFNMKMEGDDADPR